LSARRALLERLIDHAALFPPASLTMDEAVAADRAARAGEHAWMLGRFIVPASRLGELPAGFAPRLSVVADVDPLPPLPAAVELVEVRAPRTVSVPPGVRVFTEVRPGMPLPEGDAKLRCGGETFPSVEEVAAFVAACHGAGKAFKATAGLHHPLRTPSRHGFLNLLAAAVFVGSVDERELVALVGEEDPRAFTLDDEAFTARGHRADAATIAAARRDLFVAYGSCSFSEPVDDLRALGLL
jgi:hypothetical protein